MGSGEGDNVWRLRDGSWKSWRVPLTYTSALWAADDSAYLCADGTFWQLRGERWQNISADVGGRADAIAGTAPDDVWAAGNDGLWHFDGNQWSRRSERRLQKLAATTRNTVTGFTGSTFVRVSDAGETEVDLDAALDTTGSDGLTTLVATGPRVVLVGGSGTLIRVVGEQAVLDTQSSVPAFRSSTNLWFLDRGERVMATTERVVRGADGQFADLGWPDFYPYSSVPSGLWADGAGGVFVASNNGELARYTAGGWEVHNRATGLTAGYRDCILAGHSASRVVAACPGRIHLWNGSSWHTDDGAPSTGTTALAVTGHQVVLARHDGLWTNLSGSWNQVGRSGYSHPSVVAMANGDVYALEDAAITLKLTHYHDGSWSVVELDKRFTYPTLLTDGTTLLLRNQRALYRVNPATGRLTALGELRATEGVAYYQGKVTAALGKALGSFAVP